MVTTFHNKLLVPFILMGLFFITYTYLNVSPVYVKNNTVLALDSNTPGGYVKYLYPTTSNGSYCAFNYDLPKALRYGVSDLRFGPELGQNSSYRILYNVIKAKLTENVPPVTYATHVSANFISLLPELLRFWEGPVSITAFVPDFDVKLILEEIHHYCYCIPEMSRVSLHLVFDETLPPSKDVGFDSIPLHCNIEDASKFQTYRSMNKNVVYPVNVCRNSARSGSLTEYVMVSDIELMPSEGLASRFLKMLKKNPKAQCCNKVYVIPIFEVESTESIPREKTELIHLMKEEKAVYFHRLICSHCQKFPRIEAWLNSNPGNVIKPFVVTKREAPYNRWEPIYIGTKNEPFYNEALSWEGLQDKMLQMLEMCLIGYKFVILDGAFLVHWPGIKKTKTKDVEHWRTPFEKENQRQYQKILKKLSQKYEPKPQCKLK